MNKLILKALEEAKIKVDKITPKTKKETKSISIIDIKPTELLSFMKENNIPEDAFFNGADNGYDGWDDILLSWYIDVPTTEKDKLDFKRKRFNLISFKYVYNELIENGYKRVGCDSFLLKDFRNTTVYDMYMNKDFDKLFKYYSLFFNKL